MLHFTLVTFPTFVSCIFRPALRALSCCVFQSALGCSSYTDISYHDTPMYTYQHTTFLCTTSNSVSTAPICLALEKYSTFYISNLKQQKIALEIRFDKWCLELAYLPYLIKMIYTQSSIFSLLTKSKTFS